MMSALPDDVWQIFQTAGVNPAPYVYVGERKAMPSRLTIWRYWRNVVGTKSEKVCISCGYETSGNLDRAHITPRCNGGPNTADNILLLCRLCHRATEFWPLPAWKQLFEMRGWPAQLDKEAA